MTRESLWQALRRRLVRDPGPEFDRKFWARFEKEQGGAREPREVWRIFSGRRGFLRAFAGWGASAAAAGLAWLMFRPSSEPPGEAELLADSEALGEELEMLEALDDMEDLADLSDEDWELLIEDDWSEG
ncbi:MAG: hypothetical protein IT285_02730 [Bdellovibrionales bacterium]|nr:hypothetical protein [Bdellovibrionales bacterium]